MTILENEDCVICVTSNHLAVLIGGDVEATDKVTLVGVFVHLGILARVDPHKFLKGLVLRLPNVNEGTARFCVGENFVLHFFSLFLSVGLSLAWGSDSLATHLATPIVADGAIAVRVIGDHAVLSYEHG